jgi:hypothetical protein
VRKQATKIMAADIPYFALNNGVRVPSVGLGYVTLRAGIAAGSFLMEGGQVLAWGARWRRAGVCDGLEGAPGASCLSRGMD